MIILGESMSNDHLLCLNSFTFSRLPKIIFGRGTFAKLADEICCYGERVLIVTGSHSFTNSAHWTDLKKQLSAKGINWSLVHIAGEPSPDLIDDAVTQYHQTNMNVVVAVGGGSALDAGKAIAGLLIQGQSVMDHLEGVGRGLVFAGPSLPFIAVPTTAGTGSEMTKNAVLSDNNQGFKKSFRDPKLTAHLAIIDPELLDGCPRPQLIANAMDAFTQLLESYTSPRSNPITDALALSGLEYFLAGFSQNSEADLAGLDYLAYASMISGICLAQTGLGAVHGLASPLGANFPIPHGVACGTTLAIVTKTNIAALQARQPNAVALTRYAQVGRLLVHRPQLDHHLALISLVDTLTHWTNILSLPTLSRYGMTVDDIELIVKESAGNSMKTNPLILTKQELTQILHARL